MIAIGTTPANVIEVESLVKQLEDVAAACHIDLIPAFDTHGGKNIMLRATDRSLISRRLINSLLALNVARNDPFFQLGHHIPIPDFVLGHLYMKLATTVSIKHWTINVGRVIPCGSSPRVPDVAIEECFRRGHLRSATIQHSMSSVELSELLACIAADYGLERVSITGEALSDDHFGLILRIITCNRTLRSLHVSSALLSRPSLGTMTLIANALKNNWALTYFTADTPPNAAMATGYTSYTDVVDGEGVAWLAVGTNPPEFISHEPSIHTRNVAEWWNRIQHDWWLDRAVILFSLGLPPYIVFWIAGWTKPVYCWGGRADFVPFERQKIALLEQVAQSIQKVIAARE